MMLISQWQNTIVRTALALALPVFCFCFAPKAQSFVFISGPTKAKLDVSEDHPRVQFAFSTNIPDISGKETYRGGIYASQSKEEFWRTIVLEAMAPWTAIPDAYVSLEIMDGVTAKLDPNDKILSINVDSISLSAAAWANPIVEDDKIVDCDITVSDRGSGARDLAYTMMHEIGHCLGLGHNHTNYDAVMGYARGDRSLRLGNDDKAGIVFLYPRENVEHPKETLGCGSIGALPLSSTPPSRYLFLFLLMLLIPMFVAAAMRGCSPRFTPQTKTPRPLP